MRCGKVLISLLLVVAIFVIAIPAATFAQGTNNTTSNFQNFVNTITKNPMVLLTIAIQFSLGIALGYVSVKALKYILGFIGLLILGAVLSAWSLGNSSQGFIVKLKTEAHQMIPYLKGLLATLGLLTIGPLSIGFIIGALIGLFKKEKVPKTTS